MASEVKVILNEDDLPGEMITLEGDGFSTDDLEDYELTGEYTYLSIWVRKDTQVPSLIELNEFREAIEPTIQELRDNPLPWVFTLESLGIREKPLEDVLLAVWKKYRGIKMEWE